MFCNHENINHETNTVLEDGHFELNVILGASGGVGRAIVAQLLASKRPVRAVGRTLPDWVKSLEGRGGFEWRSADLEDPKAALATIQGATTTYFAAQPPYGEWLERFPAMTTNVVEGSAHAGSKLVVVDNLYMYGPTPSVLHERLPRAATGRKGSTRARMEDQLMKAHSDGKVRVTIGRLSDYYGPNGSNTIVSALVFEKALAGKAMQWPGRSDVPRTLHYLADAARGLVVIADRLEADGKTWHLPSAEPITGAQFMALVNKNAPKPVKVKIISTQMMKIGGLFSPEAKETVECMYQWTSPFVVDSSAFTNQFGSIQTTSHAQAVQATIESMLAKP